MIILFAKILWYLLESGWTGTVDDGLLYCR